MRGGKEQEVFAVRQKLGPTMGGVFRRFQPGYDGRSAAIGADLPQGIPVVRLKQNDVVLVPASTTRVGSVGQDDHWAAGHGNLFEMTICEESQRFPIRGPEWEGSAFCSFD